MAKLQLPNSTLATLDPGQIPSPLPGSVARALEWLRRNPDGEVSLDRLADVAGVRPRTLEAHFREFLGTTPLGWVRDARLARARRDLLAAGSDTSVTRVALARGFNQLGRFAGAYRARFGETPGETLRRARRTGAAAAEEIDDEALRLAWSALPLAFAVAPDSNARALELLEQALERAPHFVLAQAMASWCWAQRAAQHFGGDPTADLARARQLVEQASEASSQDALALALCGGTLALAHRVHEADAIIQTAVAQDSSLAIAWLRRGWSSAYLGDGAGALRELRTALSLAPLDPVRHLAFIGIGCAHFGAERWERAIAWTSSGVQASPQSFWAERVVIAAAVHAGAQAEAERRARALMRQDPDLTVELARHAWPFPAAFMERLCDGLQRAGLPRR